MPHCLPVLLGGRLLASLAPWQVTTTKLLQQLNLFLLAELCNEGSILVVGVGGGVCFYKYDLGRAKKCSYCQAGTFSPVLTSSVPLLGVETWV